MKLSLEDWFPILPYRWLDLYSMPVSLWPLILLWSGGHKHRTDSKSYRKGRAIAKGRQKKGGSYEMMEWLVVELRGGCELIKPSSDRSVSVYGVCCGGEAVRVCGEEWREKGTAVSRVDRDVSFALVILGCLGTARGQHGAHESSGMTGQTTRTTPEGGLAGWTNQSGRM